MAELAPASLLLVTGEEDERAPPADLEVLRERAPWAETWIVPGASHENLAHAAGGELFTRIVDFFERARRRHP